MTDIRDAEGMALAVGTRVRTGTEEGTVVRITEPDADVNEHGAPESLGPQVIVEYDNGDTEHWVAQNWDAGGELGFFRCDDVDVVT
jgi:hypothetical protein